ncbi:MAG: DnaJ domain-containing protein, partial [Thermoleophilaceae bacterium]|nr:DnaJ domain-containing protein [Thermoleophilaceae bacterium]
MASKDPYKVLGVAKGANADEVKKAYRKLARKLHPDRNPDNPKAEDQFKDVQEAYATLSDPEKRRAHDNGSMFGGSPGGNPFAGARNVRFDDLGGFGDILGGMFGGGGGRRQRAERGSDLETEVSLGFDQSIAGTQVSVSVPRRERCGTCHGNGAAPGTTPKQCTRCGGRGVEQQGQGMFSISQPCSQCHGQGTIIEKPCPT